MTIDDRDQAVRLADTLRACQDMAAQLTQDLQTVLRQRGDPRSVTEYVAETTDWQGLIGSDETGWNRVVFPAEQCVIFARIAALRGLDAQYVGNWLAVLDTGTRPVTTDTLAGLINTEV